MNYFDSLSSCQSILAQLKEDFSEDPCDLQKCQNLLSKLLKIIPFFPTYTLSSDHINQYELDVIVETLELAIFASIKNLDLNAFERYFAQVSTFYFNPKQPFIFNDTQYVILATNLLNLIASNKLASFHMALELLSPEDKKNVYISFVIQIETNLMFGNYKKVLALQSEEINPTFFPFIEILANSVRQKVAQCLEKAYTHIKITHIQKLLELPTEEEVLFFANNQARKKLESGEPSIKWKVVGDEIFFDKKNVNQEEDLSSFKIIRNCIDYATELEKIV